MLIYRLRSLSQHHAIIFACVPVSNILFYTHTHTQKYTPPLPVYWFKPSISLPVFLVFVQCPGLWMPGCAPVKSPPQPSSAAPSLASTPACSPSGRPGVPAYTITARNHRERKVRWSKLDMRQKQALPGFPKCNQKSLRFLKYMFKHFPIIHGSLKGKKTAVACWKRFCCVLRFTSNAHVQFQRLECVCVHLYNL